MAINQVISSSLWPSARAFPSTCLFPVSIGPSPCHLQCDNRRVDLYGRTGGWVSEDCLWRPFYVATCWRVKMLKLRRKSTSLLNPFGFTWWPIVVSITDYSMRPTPFLNTLGQLMYSWFGVKPADFNLHQESLWKAYVWWAHKLWMETPAIWCLLTQLTFYRIRKAAKISSTWTAQC